MIEVFQIILTYQSGNLVDESHVWWSKEKYGENLQFYDSKFIDLAGKIKYEIEFRESRRLRTHNSPKVSGIGYGIKRTLIKKNTNEIRDVSANILKEKEELKKTVKSYLSDLSECSNRVFNEQIKCLREKTENIEDDTGDLDSQPHRIPDKMFINKSKRKK